MKELEQGGNWQPDKTWMDSDNSLKLNIQKVPTRVWEKNIIGKRNKML